jgi:hypothetical protein
MSSLTVEPANVEKQAHLQQHIIDIILRQTDYTEEQTIAKMKEHNNNAIAIIREYVSGSKGVKKETTEKSTNQQIYGEIRGLMDDASKRYLAQKAYEKRKEEYMKYMEEKRLSEEQQKTDISNVIII